MAAASVDGVKRDALVFLFLGGTDACGQDICAYVKQIIREKPRLRVNIVDLSDTHGVAECVGKLPRVGSYIWGDVKRDEKSVDLSRETARMLAPVGESRRAPEIPATPLPQLSWQGHLPHPMPDFAR